MNKNPRYRVRSFLRPVWLTALMAIVMCIQFSGCKIRDRIHGKYSGQFQCENHSPIDIYLHNCTGFGFISPQCGRLSTKTKAAKFFPPTKNIPKQTTFQWRIVSSIEEREQTISLEGVIPQGVNGITVFEFTNEEVWTVKFVPGNDYESK